MPDEDKTSEMRPTATAVPDDSVPDADVVEARPVREAPETRAMPEHPQRSPAFFPLVLGGVVAASIGFGAAQFVPQGWPIAADDRLEQALVVQDAEIAALKTALDELAARPAPDMSGELSAFRTEMEQRLNALPVPVDSSAEVAALRKVVDDALAAFDLRLTEVEKAPGGAAGGASATAIAAYERDLQALRRQVDQLAGADAAAGAEIDAAVASAKAEFAAAAQEAERLKSDATVAARIARLDVALGRIEAALDAGGPFASAIKDLTAAGIEVPPVLAAGAETGIETLTDLQRQFPPAARKALDAALRSEVGDGWSDRFTAFLRTQTGARSLEPREGDDPDAVLSRAEAALQAGDLSAALTEVGSLPDAAKEPMADWIAAAGVRQQAEAAVGTVAAAIGTQ
jgi:hypothetical protein